MTRPERMGFLLAVALAVGASGAHADELLYYIEDGKVVFTNTPSRRDVKAVPRSGWEARRGGAPLPSTRYDGFIDRVARENGLDPSLVKAVALVESGFNPSAVSSKGARGLMQLMPATARRYGVRNVHDPYENLRAGTEHLRDLLDEFDGNVTLALAAYNAGSGAVRRSGGVPNYRETRDYVRKIKNRLEGPTRRARPSPPPATTTITMQVNPDGSISLVN